MVTFFSPLIEKLKRDGGTLPVAYPGTTTTDEGGRQRDVIGVGGRPRWIAYRVIFGTGQTLHLDVNPRGDYGTGTFAYYFIRRGERHGLRMESAWSNGKAAYRCRHGRTSAMAPDPGRPKNTYIREDKLLPHLPALHLLLTRPAVRARRRTRAGADVKSTASPGEVIGYLREHEIALTWNPAAAAIQARSTETAKAVTVKTN